MRICLTHVRVLSPLGHLRRNAQTYARCQLTVTSHICIFLSRGVIKRFHMQPNAVLFVFLGLVCHLVAVLSRPPPLPPILLSLLSRAGRWGAFSGGFAAIAYLVLSQYPAMDQSNNVSRLILPHHFHWLKKSNQFRLDVQPLGKTNSDMSAVISPPKKTRISLLCA